MHLEGRTDYLQRPCASISQNVSSSARIVQQTLAKTFESVVTNELAYHPMDGSDDSRTFLGLSAPSGCPHASGCARGVGVHGGAAGKLEVGRFRGTNPLDVRQDHLLLRHNGEISLQPSPRLWVNTCPFVNL